MEHCRFVENYIHLVKVVFHNMCVYVSIYLYVFFVKKQIIILLKFCSILCLILLFSGFDSLMELSSLQQWFRTLVRKQSFN